MSAAIEAEHDQESSCDVQGGSTSSSELWATIDECIAMNQTRPSTSNSMVILRSYLEQGNISRKECPLRWWANNGTTFSSLCHFVKKYMSIPATSVPSERIFSKAGEIILLKRNRLKSKNVDMIMFLNVYYFVNNLLL